MVWCGGTEVCDSPVSPELHDNLWSPLRAAAETDCEHERHEGEYMYASK